MHDPIAYFLTWTCYGTWLPGDDRGWAKWNKGDNVPQPLLADWCREKLIEEPILLGDCQREIVNQTVREHCKVRAWQLYAVNCRTNHCHCVLTAADYAGTEVLSQLKSWCTRRLKADQAVHDGGEAHSRASWWTRGGSVRYIFEEDALEAAILYTLESQETGGSKRV